MAKAAKITIAEVYIKSISITVILSNFRKTRIVSYRIFFKNLEKKKQRIKQTRIYKYKYKYFKVRFFNFYS